MKRRFWKFLTAAFALLSLVQNAQAQTAAPLTNPFVLGVALQMPTAQAEAFLQSVRALRDAATADDTTAAIGNLQQQSQVLRLSEQHGYQEAAHRLTAMGAPPSLRDWTNGAARLLSEPLILSQDAKATAKSDPKAAAVLATIDEAEALKLIADRNTAALQTWLKTDPRGEWRLGDYPGTSRQRACILPQSITSPIYCPEKPS